MATKKEGAQRLLDTLESKKKLKPRLMFALGQAFAVSVYMVFSGLAVRSCCNSCVWVVDTIRS